MELKGKTRTIFIILAVIGGLALILGQILIYLPYLAK